MKVYYLFREENLISRLRSDRLKQDSYMFLWKKLGTTQVMSPDRLDMRFPTPLLDFSLPSISLEPIKVPQVLHPKEGNTNLLIVHASTYPH
jgi:hypothetical protein